MGFPCPGGLSLRVLAAAARNLVNTSHETEEPGLGNSWLEAPHSGSRPSGPVSRERAQVSKLSNKCP